MRRLSNDKQPPAPPRPNGDARQPVPVRIAKFVGPQDGPGLNVTSSATSRHHSKQSRHELDWLPWCQLLRVTYFPPEAPPMVGFIPAARILYFEAVDQSAG